MPSINVMGFSTRGTVSLCIRTQAEIASSLAFFSAPFENPNFLIAVSRNFCSSSFGNSTFITISTYVHKYDLNLSNAIWLALQSLRLIQSMPQPEEKIPAFAVVNFLSGWGIRAHADIGITLLVKKQADASAGI